MKFLTFTAFLFLFQSSLMAQFRRPRVKPDLTYWGEVSGMVRETIIDYKNGKHKKLLYIEETGTNKNFRINLESLTTSKNSIEIKPGKSMTLQGMRYFYRDQIDVQNSVEYFSLENIYNRPITTQTYGVDAIRFGVGITERTALFVRVNLIDSQAFISTSGLQALLPKVQQTYLDSSYGKIYFNLDKNNDSQIDIESVSINARTTDTSSCGLFSFEWTNMAKDVLTARGVDYDSYDHVVLYFPLGSKFGCNGIGGQGTIATNYTTDRTQYSWILSEFQNDHVVTTHEMGHNIGLGHAGTDPDNDDNTNSSYGDRTSFMGNGKVVNLNLPNMVSLGLFDGFKESLVDSTAMNETIDIAALDIHPHDTTLPAAVRIYKAVRDDGIHYSYFLSYRRNVLGYDSNITSEHLNGVNIYKSRDKAEKNRSTLTRYVGTLSDGESLTDPELGVTIAQISHSLDSVRVNIDRSNPAPCRPYPVEVLQITDGAHMALEQNEFKKFYIGLENRDDAHCPSTTYQMRLIGSSGSGVNFSLDRDTFTLAPGQRAWTFINVQAKDNIHAPKDLTVYINDIDDNDPYHDEKKYIAKYQVADDLTCYRKMGGIYSMYSVFENGGEHFVRLRAKLTTQSVPSYCPPTTFELEFVMPEGDDANRPDRISTGVLDPADPTKLEYIKDFTFKVRCNEVNEFSIKVSDIDGTAPHRPPTEVWNPYIYPFSSSSIFIPECN